MLLVAYTAAEACVRNGPADSVIDTLALYILPNKRRYRQSVYDESMVLKQDSINDSSISK